MTKISLCLWFENAITKLKPFIRDARAWIALAIEAAAAIGCSAKLTLCDQFTCGVDRILLVPRMHLERVSRLRVRLRNVYLMSGELLRRGTNLACSRK